MNYDWHVRWTQYLRRINAAACTDHPFVGQTEEEDHAAQALWNAEVTELDRLAQVAWDNDPSLHPEKRKKRVKAKTVGR